jgi:putative flippase GtrA
MHLSKCEPRISRMAISAAKGRQNRLFTRSASWQFSKFVVVGASNTSISLLSYVGLCRLGVTYVIAGAIAFVAGAVDGYLLNRRWTFNAPDSWQARSRYVVVQVAGLAGTIVLLWSFVSVAGAGRLTAYAVTIPTVTLATFAANRGWTFRPSLDSRHG